MLCVALAFGFACSSTTKSTTNTTAPDASAGSGGQTGASGSTSGGNGSSDGGSAGIDSAGANGEGGEPNDGGTDAPVGRCNPLAPFGEPEKVTGIGSDTTKEAYTRLTQDELHAVFTCEMTSADSGMHFGICAADRTSTDAPFEAATMEVYEPPSGNAVWPSLTADRLAVFFTINPTGATDGEDIVVATRPSTSADFGMPVLVPDPVSLAGAGDLSPYVLPDGSALYFTGHRAGTYLTLRAERSGVAFTEPEVVLGVVAGAIDDPVPTQDELTLYGTNAGAVPKNILVSRRSTLVDGFPAFELVEELSTVDDDIPTWVSDDGCVLYFNSTRDGDADVFRAQRGL